MQVTPAVHALKHRFSLPAGPGLTLDRFVYSFVLAGDTITLIDTGVAGCEDRIFEYIRTIGRDPAEISLVILTHAHPDHIGALKAIRQTTGCTVMAHAAERAWIEDVGLQNRERPVPGFSTLVGGPVPIDHELTDGTIIDTDGTELFEIHVIHTPGHSAGSISLHLPSEGVLFCGDAVPVSGDLPIYESAAQSLRSLQRLRAIPDIRALLSAWDEPRQGAEGYDRIDRAVDYLHRIHKVVSASSTAGNSDLMEITRHAAAGLGLPREAVTPLLARTFAANLREKNEMDL